MTDSDVESDEEFQATLSYLKDDLLNQPQRVGGVQRVSWLYEKQLIMNLLTTQIASGRVDRVESILLLSMRFHQEKSISQALVDDVIHHAMSQAASRGNLGAVRMICRITAGFDFSIANLIAKQHAAIRILLFQNENPSCVEALRELGFDEGFSQVFDLIKNGVARKVFGMYKSTPESVTILQWNFLFAALSGDLEEVKRILDDQQTDMRKLLDVYLFKNRRGWLCHAWHCSAPLCAAAARGHWKVVKAILAKLTAAERLGTASSLSHRGHRGHPPAHLPLLEIHNLYRSFVIFAARRNDLSIFSEKFPELENAIADASFLSVLFRESQAEFMEKVMVLCNFRLQHNRAMDFYGTFLQSLKFIFSRESRFHACPRHLDFLMQEIFAQTFVSVKVLAPFLLDLLWATKRVSVVKRVLLFKPRFFIDDAFLDLEDYKFHRCSKSLWRRGVRLLVEAGVKASSPVPAKRTELFSLSLQDRCLIIVRGCLKVPVRESVKKLPLPPTLKRRLLYRSDFL